MELKEFKELFDILCANCSNIIQKDVEWKTKPYYEQLKMFSPNIWLEVVDEELRYTPIKLRDSGYYKMKCYAAFRKSQSDISRYKNGKIDYTTLSSTQKEEFNRLPYSEQIEADPMYGRRKEDIEAAAEFFKLLGRVGDSNRPTSEGFSNIGYCLGLAGEDIIKSMKNVNKTPL